MPPRVSPRTSGTRTSHAAVAEEAGRHGELAVWVNNAGVGFDGTLTAVTSEHVHALVDVNLKGVLWGMRAALASFGPAGGDVVNVASISGLGPVPGLAVYAATKAAVVSVTMSASVEAPKGVRVHALCPDGVEGVMVDAMDPAGAAKAIVHSAGRLLTVEETALAAVGLVGSRRVVLSLPGWRGGLTRVGTAAAVAVGGRVPAVRAARPPRDAATPSLTGPRNAVRTNVRLVLDSFEQVL